MIKQNKLLFTLLILASTVWATSSEPLEYTGPRKAGMGGSGVADICQRESVFYNPAAISRMNNGIILPLLNYSAMLNEETMTVIDKSNDSDGADTDSLSAIEKLIPAELGFGLNTNTSIVGDFPFKWFADKWSINGYLFSKINGQIKNPVSPTIKLFGSADVVMPAVTLAKNLDSGEDFFLKNISTGITFKRINRLTLYDEERDLESFELPVLSLLEGSADYGYQYGQGYGIDLGIIGDLGSDKTQVALAISNLATSIKGTRIVASDTGDETYTFTQNIPTTAKAGIAHRNDFIARIIPFIGYKISQTPRETIEIAPEIIQTTNTTSPIDTKDVEASNPEAENKQDKEVPNKLMADTTEIIEISDIDNIENTPKATPNPKKKEVVEDTIIVEAENITDTTTPTTIASTTMITHFSETIFTADFDIVAPTDQSIFKRVHLGLEQPIFPFFDLRMGLNQGYGTMGFDINLINTFHIGYTYFTEELGSELGQAPASYHIYDIGFYW